MKHINEYLSVKVKPTTIKADNTTLKKIIVGEVEHLGIDADLNHIDVSKCTSLRMTFSDVFLYNNHFFGDVSKWNTENVRDFYYTFAYCDKFNGYLGEWDMSNAVSLDNMFYKCDSFEGNGLDQWDVHKVERAKSTFSNCYKFNGDLSKWNISSLKEASYMFYHCLEFNCDLSKWDTTNLIHCDHMFIDCHNFKGDISTWKLNKLRNCEQMFAYSNYYKDLSSLYIPDNAFILRMFADCTSLESNKNFWPEIIKRKYGNEPEKIFNYY